MLAVWWRELTTRPEYSLLRRHVEGIVSGRLMPLHRGGKPKTTLQSVCVRGAIYVFDVCVCVLQGYACMTEKNCLRPRDRFQVLGIRHTGKFEQPRVVHDWTEGALATKTLAPSSPISDGRLA